MVQTILYAHERINISIRIIWLLQPKKAKSGKGKKKGGGGKKKGKGKGKGKKKSAAAAEKKPVPVADPLSQAAMLNAYYISHGPVEFLTYRGYSWSGGGGAGKKKKKGGGKKKRKWYLHNSILINIFILHVGDIFWINIILTKSILVLMLSCGVS